MYWMHIAISDAAYEAIVFHSFLHPEHFLWKSKLVPNIFFQTGSV